MNFTSFQYFLAVKKAGSIRGAANELMISQQALSEQIRRLENELGVKLIAATKPATLTACGEHFADYAASMLQQKRQLERELAELSGQQKELIISVPSTNCPPMLSEVVALFTTEHPDCKVTIKERRDGAGKTELMEYDLNISSKSLDDGLEQIRVQAQGSQSREEMPGPVTVNSNRLSVFAHENLLKKYWGASYDAKCRQLREKPELRLFADIPFIRVDGQDNTAIDLLMIENGFAPKIVSGTDTFDIGFSLCCSGVGALILPDGMVFRKLGANYESNQMLLVSIGAIFPPLDIIISYQKGKALSELEQAFVAAVVHHMDQNHQVD
jgi:molybdenum-dependent DNA-binding transcriptional regulator ModE